MNNKSDSKPIALPPDFGDVLRQIQQTRQNVFAQGNTALFRPSSLSIKLSIALRVLQPGMGKIFKDRYVLEFLGLPAPHSESDLKRALVQYEGVGYE